jgi:hypothetical protein
MADDSGEVFVGTEPTPEVVPIKAFLRPKITPVLEEDGTICLKISWISTGPDNELAKDPITGEPVVVFSESCRIGPERVGDVGYVSEVGVPDYAAAHAGLGAFFVDKAGMRHFRVLAERYDFQAVPQPIG